MPAPADEDRRGLSLRDGDEDDLGRGALDERHRAAGGGEREGRDDEREDERRADANDETDGSHALGSFEGVRHAFQPNAWQ